LRDRPENVDVEFDLTPEMVQAALNAFTPYLEADGNISHVSLKDAVELSLANALQILSSTQRAKDASLR